MIAADKCKAVFLLHQEGMSEREISRRLGLSRNSVHCVIARQGELPARPRREKQLLDQELLQKLYDGCDGWIQRAHEKLAEEHGVKVSYQTLTRKLRELGISTPKRQRCERRGDTPGEEMQHDTSEYHVMLGSQRVRVIASLIYLRFSKRRYLTFYRAFNRFKMKCFFHDALTFWGYSAPECIIDNTNLARLRGAGADAVISPEMDAFGKQYGFRFRCHAIGHANRKAGEERSFYTTESNFIPGRTFLDMEDLNAQALQWATERLEHRAQGKARLIPHQAFEQERSLLVKLPPHLPAPYLTHERETDQYGYVAFDGNFYWVPGTRREGIKVLEYARRLQLFEGRECVAEYSLPADGVHNAQFSPPGQPAPRHNANNRKKPTVEEEQRLRTIAPVVDAYLTFALKPQGISRHRFLRQLFALNRQLAPAIFIQTIERALRYRINDIDTLRRIAKLYFQPGESSLPDPSVDENFRNRDTYQEGHLTDAPDFTPYDKMLEEENNNEPE